MHLFSPRISFLLLSLTDSCYNLSGPERGEVHVCRDYAPLTFPPCYVSLLPSPSLFLTSSLIIANSTIKCAVNLKTPIIIMPPTTTEEVGQTASSLNGMVIYAGLVMMCRHRSECKVRNVLPLNGSHMGGEGKDDLHYTSYISNLCISYVSKLACQLSVNISHLLDYRLFILLFFIPPMWSSMMER